MVAGVTLHDLSVALVADADAHESARLSRQLSSHGWQVITAADGTSALRELCSRPVSLAIVRVDLPDLAGLEVIASARAAGWRARVIFLDAIEQPEIRRKCKDLGALAYLVEPITAQALAAALWRARQASADRSEGGAPVEDALGELQPGTQADLCIRTGAAAGSYVATVTEVGPASLSLLTQARDGSTLYIGLGTPVYVGYPTRHGWAEFEARVSSSCIRHTLTELALARPEHIVYRQRRRWPRMRAILPIRAWPTSHPDRAGVMVTGQTEDLGKHGLKACFTGPLPESESVTLALEGGRGLRELRLSGRPVWEQAPREASGPRTYRYGFEFTHLTPALRLAVDELLVQMSSSAEASRGRSQAAASVETGTRAPLK